MKKIDCIIVSAGKSSRFQSKTKKQFFLLNKVPVIIHTIRKFHKKKFINSIILVISKEDQNKVEKILKKHKLNKHVKIVFGGNKRSDSVYNGIKKSNADYVFVHDGARPYVSERVLNELIKNHKKNSICVPYIKPSETVRYNKNIVQLLDRKNIYLIQTPQFVERKYLIRSMEKFMNKNKYFTDEAEYIIRNNGKIIFIEGNRENIKITKTEDIYLMKYFIKRS